MITIFKSILQTDSPFHRELSVALERIRDGKSRETVEKIRSSKSPDEKNELKKQLPAICFSGTFSRRSDKDILSHSGFICLDFDGYQSIREANKKKTELKRDKYTYAAWISPSGVGVKVLVKIPSEKDKHKGFFNALRDHYDDNHFDISCSNLSRVCYESYDPDLFINEKSLVWKEVKEETYEQKSWANSEPTIPVTDSSEIINRLVGWWNKNYGMDVVGERNRNLFILAAAFNNFGIPKNEAFSFLSQYEQKDFSLAEINTTVNSAYSNTSGFATRFFEDEEKVGEVSRELRRGASKKELRSDLIASGIESAVADAALDRIEEELDNFKFWVLGDRGQLRIDHIKFRDFLKAYGYAKYQKGKEMYFVKINENIVTKIDSVVQIKDFVIEQVERLLSDNPQERILVMQKLLSDTGLWRTELLNMVDTIEINFLKDQRKESWFYFSNGIVRVTPDDVEIMDLMEKDNYVWKDHVRPREFAIGPSECMFEEFIKLISKGDQNRKRSIESAIGFSLLRWKDKAKPKCIVLNDEAISSGAQGGSGKGILIQALKELRNVKILDGKSFDSIGDKFAFQTITEDTDIIHLDDIAKNFNFEMLFSVMTEGVEIEQKGRDKISLGFEDSPKFTMSTNYTIHGNDASHARRRFEIELHNHFTADHTPEDEFGGLLFSDELWRDSEWSAFYNYMIKCLQDYMKNGLIPMNSENMRRKKELSEVGQEVSDFLRELMSMKNSPIELGRPFRVKELYTSFIEEYGTIFKSQNVFKQRLIKFNEYYNGQVPTIAGGSMTFNGDAPITDDSLFQPKQTAIQFDSNDSDICPF